MVQTDIQQDGHGNSMTDWAQWGQFSEFLMNKLIRKYRAMQFSASCNTKTKVYYWERHCTKPIPKKSIF